MKNIDTPHRPLATDQANLSAGHIVPARIKKVRYDHCDLDLLASEDGPVLIEKVQGRLGADHPARLVLLTAKPGSPFFVSRTRANDAFVRQICEALEARHLSVWVDLRELRGGNKLG
jgi:hypothetical protein